MNQNVENHMVLELPNAPWNQDEEDREIEQEYDPTEVDYYEDMPTVEMGVCVYCSEPHPLDEMELIHLESGEIEYLCFNH